jgi:hypothetical protein
MVLWLWNATGDVPDVEHISKQELRELSNQQNRNNENY